MSRLKTIVYLGWIFSLASSAWADDFIGTRPLGMGGAHRAIVTGNDSIYMNPAGMSLFQRYSFEAQYFLSPNFGIEDGPIQHVFNASVVDNQIQLFATGLAYTRVERDDQKRGNRFDLAFSTSVSENLLLGTDIKYINFDRDDKEDAVDAVTIDIGALFRLMVGEESSVSIGVVGYNLTNTADYFEHPISMAAALLYSPFRTLEITFDWFINFQKPVDPAKPLEEKETGFSYHIGAEYLLLSQITFRAGYEIDQARPGDSEHYWSAGLGYIDSRIAIDFGYRGSIHNTWDNTFGFGIRLFM